ncbi:MAG: cupin domain-containing protein [Flavobacterium sp.]
MTDKVKNILTVNPDEGQKLMIAGGNYRIIVSGKETGGTFAVIEMSIPPGAGPNPHSHASFEESFYVLEGEINFKSESGNYVAKENAFISIPKGGMVHGFKNLTNNPAKLLCTVIPAGLDEFFQEVSDFIEIAKIKASYSQIEIKENLALISEKFGQKLFDEDYLD